jgi:hypothetical protein
LQTRPRPWYCCTQAQVYSTLCSSRPCV